MLSSRLNPARSLSGELGVSDPRPKFNPEIMENPQLKNAIPTQKARHQNQRVNSFQKNLNKTHTRCRDLHLKSKWRSRERVAAGNRAQPRRPNSLAAASNSAAVSGSSLLQDSAVSGSSPLQDSAVSSDSSASAGGDAAVSSRARDRRHQKRDRAVGEGFGSPVRSSDVRE